MYAIEIVTTKGLRTVKITASSAQEARAGIDRLSFVLRVYRVEA